MLGDWGYSRRMPPPLTLNNIRFFDYSLFFRCIFSADPVEKIRVNCKTERAPCSSTERVPDHIRLPKEANMAVVDVTKKTGIYHTLYQINAAFAAIVEHYRALRAMGALTTRVTRRYEGFTLELQAEFNQDFLLPLHEIEFEDWSHFGKVRQEWERYLRGSDDDSLHAGDGTRKGKTASGKQTKAKKSRPLKK
jgi:hypothetical protein